MMLHSAAVFFKLEAGLRPIVDLEGDIIDAGKRTYDHAGLLHRGIRGIGPPDVCGWAQAAR